MSASQVVAVLGHCQAGQNLPLRASTPTILPQVTQHNTACLCVPAYFLSLLLPVMHAVLGTCQPVAVLVAGPLPGLWFSMLS